MSQISYTLGAILAEFTGDIDGAFERATDRIIDWIVIDDGDRDQEHR